MNKPVYITSIASFLPNKAIDNDHIEDVLGQVGPKPSKAKKVILRSNKIKNRYYALDPLSRDITHTNTELTSQAIKNLKQDDFNIVDIDLLACGTSLPDQLLPNHAVMVHGELEIPPCEVVSTSGICVSGMMSLKYAYMSVALGESQKAVATGSENVSSLMRAENFAVEIQSQLDAKEDYPKIPFEKDFLRWMLSDGAGAVLLSDKKNKNGLSLEIEWIVQKSYANEIETCMYAGGEKREDKSVKGYREFAPKQWLDESIFSIKQDLKLLNANIVDYTVTKPLKKLVLDKKVIADEITYFLPHYSSGYFEDKLHAGMLEANCDIPKERWFTNLTSKGNTGSASIYIILDELYHSGKLNIGDTILCYIPESGRFSTAFMKLKVC